MAVLDDINTQLTALTAAINRAVPIIQAAPGSVPADQLAPVLAAITALVSALNAALPPNP